MSLKFEVQRKAIHMVGLLAPFSLIYFGKDLTLIFLAIILIIFFVVEPYRTKRIDIRIMEGIEPFVNEVLRAKISESLRKIEEKMLEITREEERFFIGAHIYFAAAALVTLILFPEKVVIGALTVTLISDALAALVGKGFGRHRFKNGKSVEGSLAYFLSGFLILIFIFPWYVSVIASFAGALAEFYEFPPDDNFSAPVIISAVIYLFVYV